MLQFEVELYSSSLDKEPAKDLVRKHITPQIRAALQKLAPALITEHGKDIQHAPGSNPSSGFTGVRTLQSSSVTKDKSSTPSTTTTSNGSSKGPKVNTTSLSDQQEFRTTAADAYQVFVDPQRIAAFTRAQPKVFEGSTPGSKFELFGGNVQGEYVKLEEPRP